MALLAPPEELQVNGDLEEVWPLFKQRFLLYMKAIGAAQWPSDQKVALFLTVAGPEALLVYNSFQLGPKEKEDLEAVLARFEDHCVPRHNEAYERFLFHTRLQELHEPLEDFVVDLQGKSYFCNFGDQRESLVRDQLILGCRNSHVRQQLLHQDEMTLESALKICRLAEEEEEEEGTPQHTVNFYRAEELYPVKKHTCLRASKAGKRHTPAVRGKVRCSQSLGNRKDGWQPQWVNSPRKGSVKTYV